MTTRFNVRPETVFGVSPLRGGYDGQVPTYSIPPVGIEDVDRALFTLFDKEIPFTVETQDGSTKRVSVVFAAGEKWAMMKKGPPRDKTDALVLPIIVVGRSSIEQSKETDIAGRGINQSTGELVIKRRLDVTSREHLSLLNGILLKGQQNVAVRPEDATVTDQVTTLNDIGAISNTDPIAQGGLLVPDTGEAIYETIYVPSPQFYTAKYEFTIWTQYVQDMNGILDMLIASQLPQGNAWRLVTPQGYWFIARNENNAYTAKNNFEDMSQEERMIKYTFTMTVQAYSFVPTAPGMPIPLRRSVSRPRIQFTISPSIDEIADEGGDPFLGADDPTLPSNVEQSIRRPRADGGTKLFPQRDETTPQDPALRPLERKRAGPRYLKINGKMVRVKSRNAASGETVYSSDFDLAGIRIKT
jgi:hypothetical protein